MAAYSELQQAEFASEAAGYTATRHQREVGTGYFDRVAQTLAGGESSTTALAESTEAAQFDRPSRSLRRADMTQRYWIVGGEYRDPEFTALVPGTETMAGPFADEVQGAQRMDAAHLFARHRSGDDALHHRRRGRVSEADIGRAARHRRRSGVAGAEEILTEEALGFLAALHRRFDARRQALLAAREERQRGFDAGALPDFLPETAAIRAGDWTVAPIPADLMDRRVEITGPTDRKMVINALNSGAQCFMADFEDATSPTWDECDRGPGQSARPLAGPAQLQRSGERQALCAGRRILRC